VPEAKAEAKAEAEPAIRTVGDSSVFSTSVIIGRIFASLLFCSFFFVSEEREK
jgi:hypothetical protein